MVVAWNYTGLGPKKRIFFQMIDPSTAAMITDLKQANLHDSDTDDIRNARVRVKADGTFSILWTNYSREGTTWAADFQMNGVKIGSDYQV